MSIPRAFLLAAGIAVTSAAASLPLRADGPGLGQPLAEDEIPFYARYVLPDGTGLPAGGGTALQGQPIYEEACAACHGETGAEGPIMPPVGPNPAYDKPAGRYWPYATTLFDYIRRAMPFDAPKSLSDDQVYAVTAYLLHRNGLVGEDEVVNADSLAAVEMPNRDNFIDLWQMQKDKPY